MEGKMKKIISGAVAFTVSVFIAAGCSKANEANEKNLSEAVEQYLDKHGEQCINLGIERAADGQDEIKFINASSVFALQSVGIVKKEDIKMPHGGTNTRYTLTEKAKPFERLIDTLPDHKKVPYLCYGKEVLEKVIEWHPPGYMHHDNAQVIYQYKIEDMPDWAKNPDVQLKVLGVNNEINNEGKRQHVLWFKQTNTGWESIR
jgi:hypothetical protein